MTVKPWKVLESSYFRPKFRIDKCELGNGKLLNATILEFNPWANIFALTPRDEVVLIQQYRHGVQEVLWEIPGGVVDAGEDPLEGVKRELLEETGYTASEFTLAGKLYPNPSFQTNTMYCYLARNAEKVAEQHLDGGEDIEVHLVPLDEVSSMIKRGDFPHALMVAAFFQVLSYLGRIK